MSNGIRVIQVTHGYLKLPMARRSLTLEEKLVLVAKHAPSLRAAGLEALTVEGIAMQLAPHIPPAGKDGLDRKQRDESSNPLYDSSTYADGVVPGYNLKGLNEPDEDPS